VALNVDLSNDTMKNLNLSYCVVAFILMMIEVSAQNLQDTRTGIFLSQQDFLNYNISLVAKTDEQNFLEVNQDKIMLLRNGNKSKFKYGSISGYYMNGFRFRAYGKKEKFFEDFGYYKVLDYSGLIVYSKKSSNYKNGGHIWHYYSKKLDSPIKIISEKNLKSDFADYPEFLELAIIAIKNKTITCMSNGKTVLNELYYTKAKGGHN
jgi:hypothetical protein